MDAILNYRLEDTEDYYTLLGCDELSSVRQWIMLFFFTTIFLLLFKVLTELLVTLPKNLILCYFKALLIYRKLRI